MPMLPKRPAALCHFDNGLLAPGMQVQLSAIGNADIIQLKDLSTVANETVRLDGTKYMRFQNSADFNISSSFTVSLWENLSSINGTYPCLFALSSPPIQGNMYAGLLFGYHHSGIRYLYASSNVTSWDQIYAFSLGEPTYGVWVHWEIGYDAPTKKLYLFKNGVLLNTFTFTANLYYDPSKSNYLGIPYNTGYINALIADFNFTAGICTHKSNFTPAAIGSTTPTKVLTPFTTDAVTKLGEGSGVSCGTGYLSTVVDSFILDTTNDFTVSFWEYFVDGVDNSCSFAVNGGDTIGNVVSALLIGYNYGGKKHFYASTGTSGPTNWDISNIIVIESHSNLVNRWAHWEIGYKRSTKMLYVFLDGILKYSVLCSSPLRMSSPSYTRTGRWGNVQSAYTDEVMILQGECLHTANFAPPSEPYEYPEVPPLPGFEIGESFICERSSIKSGYELELFSVGERSSTKIGYEYGNFDVKYQLTRQIRRAIRVEQIEGVGTLTRATRMARRIEQLEGVGGRTQKSKTLNDDFFGEFIDLGPRSAERSGTELESLDAGPRVAPNREGNEIISLETANREISTRNGFDLESFDFDSNAMHKYNLTVTPTHQYKSRIVEIKADLLDKTPTFGQYSLSINGDDVIPFSSIDDRINVILINVSPDKFITGNNLCRLRILRQSGDKEYLDFEVFKEEPKRTQVERLFRSYEGGYDGERMNSAVTLSAYPSFLTPRDKSTTVIKTTEFTRIPLSKYLAVQGVTVDAQGAKILVSFDEGVTWKTWGIADYLDINTGVKITPNMTSASQDGYVVTSTPAGTSSLPAFRVFDGFWTDVSNGGAFFYYASTLSLPTVAIKLPKYEVVNGYCMVGHPNTGNVAKSWRIEGSNDGGVTWEILDTQTNQTLTKNVKTIYNFANRNKHNAFRIVVTAIAGASNLYPFIVELELYGATPVYGWVNADFGNIANEGMTPEQINSKTLADWSEIFKPKSLDFAVYLDNSISNFAPVEKQELYEYMNYNSGGNANGITLTLYSNIPSTMGITKVICSGSAGTGSSGVSARASSEILAVYANNSEQRLFYSTLYGDTSKTTTNYAGDSPNKPTKIKMILWNNNGVYIAFGRAEIYTAPKTAYLKSINVQITPNPKTGYAFII